MVRQRAQFLEDVGPKKDIRRSNLVFEREQLFGQLILHLVRLPFGVFGLADPLEHLLGARAAEVVFGQIDQIVAGGVEPVADVQDDLADSVEDLAVLLTIKNLTMPEQIADDVMAYVKGVLHVCDRLYAASDDLVDLAEHDFGGPRAKKVLERIGEAEHAEWEADKMQYQLAQKLFALEDEIRATDIFLWSDIFKELGALANHADKTADRLRRMLSR